MDTLLPEAVVKGETIADVKRRALGLGNIILTVATFTNIVCMQKCADFTAHTSRRVLCKKYFKTLLKLLICYIGIQLLALYPNA